MHKNAIYSSDIRNSFEYWPCTGLYIFLFSWSNTYLVLSHVHYRLTKLPSSEYTHVYAKATLQSQPCRSWGKIECLCCLYLSTHGRKQLAILDFRDASCGRHSDLFLWKYFYFITATRGHVFFLFRPMLLIYGTDSAWYCLIQTNTHLPASVYPSKTGDQPVKGSIGPCLSSPRWIFNGGGRTFRNRHRNQI